MTSEYSVFDANHFHAIITCTLVVQRKCTQNLKEKPQTLKFNLNEYLTVDIYINLIMSNFYNQYGARETC